MFVIENNERITNTFNVRKNQSDGMALFIP